MNYRIRYSNELYHHGVLGQKWGDRNGPPYPLGSVDHSAREKKAGWRKSLNKDGSEKKIQKLEKRLKKATNEYNDFQKNGQSSDAFQSIYLSPKNAGNMYFYTTYGISKNKALKNAEEILATKKLRAEYRTKIEKGEELNEQEAKLLRQDHIKKAILIAGVTGVSIAVAYKIGLFDKTGDKLFKLSSAYSSVGDTAKGILEQDMKTGEVEHILKKGYTFHRMTGWDKEDYSGLGRLYVSSTETDRDIYKAYLRDWHKTGKRFELTLEATKDIKMASSAKQKEMFLELLEDNDFFDEVAYRVRGTKNASALVKDASMRRFLYGKDDVYKDVIYKLVDTDYSASKKYLQYAKSKGYDALIDDFDRGAMSYAPTILIDPEQLVKQVESQRISSMDTYLAETRLKSKGIVAGMFGIVLPHNPH